MVEENKYLTTIDDNEIIWRYMNFASFCSVLEKEKLFFKRLDRYSDQLEAVLYESTVQEFEERYRAKAPWSSRNNAKKYALREKWNYRHAARYILSNCWTISNHEDYALWRVYLAGTREGVAVRSTGGKLKDSLAQQNEYIISLGKVSYDEPKADDINMPIVATSKRRPYSYENEYRALIFGQHKYNRNDGSPAKPRFSVGAYVPVNLRVLIDRIYVSPFAGKWFFELVKRTVANDIGWFDVNMIFRSIIKEKRIN